MSVIESGKHVLDGVSLTAAISALAGYLPALASILSIVWYVIRIYEWYANRKELNE